MKDPAILWYWNDWAGGTKTFSRHLKGCYMDLLDAQFNSGPLSLEEIKTVLGNDFAVWGALSKKFKKTAEGLFFNERMELEKAKRSAYTESRRQSRAKSDEDNVKIYLIKDLDSENFKIGSSVNPLRRFAEMCNQLNPAITIGERNYELFWVSKVYPRSVEKDMHKMFAEKRIKGEWFNLSINDLELLFKTYEGTYVNRTSFHTENENENENENTNGLIEKGVQGEKQKIPYQLIVDEFNRTCISLAVVQKLTDSRKDKIRIRYSEIGSINKFKELFNKTQNTPFLIGNNKDCWKANFDWLMENDKNWIKVMEGNYDKNGINKENNKSVAARSGEIDAITNAVFAAKGR